MNDSNVELSFIEYEKSFLNATELDQRDGTEDKNSRKWKEQKATIYVHQQIMGDNNDPEFEEYSK